MTEGVIKFNLEFEPLPPLLVSDLAEITAWRRILYLLGLIGRDPNRYDGLGYGNISQRLPPWDALPNRRAFVVSGSQTGGLAELNAEHYAVVFECVPEENRVRAGGPIKPSAESLTHGTVYGLDGNIRFVMHVHSPLLWQAAEDLGIAVTDQAAAYGTPELAEEIRRLWKDQESWSLGLFSMGGHEDGLVAFAATARDAAMLLVDALARAMQHSRPGR